MKPSPSVLIVDDQVGDIGWLIDLIQNRGYDVMLATNEDAAQKQLDAINEGKVSYALAIIDIMVAVKDLTDLVSTLDDKFFKDSKDTGIRLCQYARNKLGISVKKLPIVCISVRDDQAVKKAMKDLGIRLFSRGPEESIRDFIESHLPEAGV